MSEIEKFTPVEFKMSKLTFLSHILILPIWVFIYFTKKLVIGKDLLIFKSGIIAKKEKKIPFSRINNVDYSESLLWKLMFQRIGNIKIHTGNDTSSIDFKSLRNPKEIAEIINDRIKSNK